MGDTRLKQYISEYLLVSGLIQELGFEKALQVVCRLIVQLHVTDNTTRKSYNYISCRLLNKICQRKVSFINKQIYRGVVSGNCIDIALYIFWYIHKLGHKPCIVNEVCLIDGKVQAHLWVRLGEYKINYMHLDNATIVREITLDKVIHDWINERCKAGVVSYK